MSQQPGRRITVRRTVPLDLRTDPPGARGRLRLTLNDLRTDPARAVLALTGPDVAERFELGVGDRVELAGQGWAVEQITPGDRGSVVLVGAP